jgi:uncharacterized protein (TIGR02231 family)
MIHPIKKSLSLILVTISLSTSAQEPVWVSNSDVKEVRIYQNGAMVSRTAKANLNAGPQEVVIEGLSPYINPGTVSLKGTGDGTIMNVSFQTDYLKERRKSKEITQLEVQLDSLSLRLQSLQNRNMMLTETQNLLLANKSIGGATNGVMADELEPVVNYFMKKFMELKDEQLANSVQEKKVRDQVEKLKRQLGELNARQNQPTGNIIVRLNANTRSAFSFDFSYSITSNVAWSPYYDLRAKDINAPLEVQLKANVSQTTGEEWNGIKLFLNTGNPALSGTKPDLSPWYLNFYQPMLQMRGARSDQAMPAAAMEKSGAVSNAQMDYVMVTQNQAATSIDYEIKESYSVPGDGKEIQVQIQNVTLPATYQYVSVPKIDPDAFLVATVANWEDLGLMAGSANIYFDGAYAGNTYVDPTSVEDSMQFSLGRDKRITVKRETVKEKTSTRMIGSNRERSAAYKITVKNNKKESIRIRIEDQYPVSQNNQIEVKLNDTSGATADQQSGKLIWQLNLAPAESKSVGFSFDVKYPKDKSIGGL